jgi:hypothetical protein
VRTHWGLFIALAIAGLAPVQACASAPTRIAFRVVGESPQLVEKFRADIDRLIRARPGYEVVDTAPVLKLLVMVNQDVNDRVNRQGVSIAITHVSNLEAYYIASKLIDSSQSDAASVKDPLISMIRQEGELEYINVAHLDKGSDAQIELVCESIVATFFEKVPANAGK